MTRGKSEKLKLTMPISESRDHIQGPSTAPVTLLEYGDYECPYCAQAYIIIKEAQERLGSKFSNSLSGNISDPQHAHFILYASGCVVFLNIKTE